MPNPKRTRGRPVKYPMPEQIADTPENVLKSHSRDAAEEA